MAYNNNYGGGDYGGGDYGGNNSHYLEDENDMMTTQLRGKVKSLKSVIMK